MILRQLRMLYNEIEELDEHQADLELLDSLVSNFVYLLGLLAKQPEFEATWLKHRQILDPMLTEVLNTSHKELLWAKQEADNETERRNWFAKAKAQFLLDMDNIWICE